MGCGDSSGCDAAAVVVVVVFVALPVVVAGVADAAGMAILDVIGNDDNDVVVANTDVAVIATVSNKTAPIWSFLVFFLKYFISVHM